jgi:hypothetical protein
MYRPMTAILLLPCLATADDVKEAHALLARGIKALGGEKLLSKPHSLSGVGKGVLKLSGREQQVSNRWTVQGLSHVRWETELSGDLNATIVLGMAGARPWISGNGGKPATVSADVAEAFQQGFLALRVAEELVPLKDKGWKLSHLGQVKVGSALAAGLKASRAGKPDIDLFFDLKTHLPIKAEIRLKKPGEEAEMTLTGLFSGYKKFDGRMHFTSLVVEQDGVKVLEMTRSEIKAGERVDAGTFERP